MSIIPLRPGNFVANRVKTNPSRHFMSSSSGVTGSLKVIVNRSEVQKDSIDMRAGLAGKDEPQKFTEDTFEGRRKLIYAGKKTPTGTGMIFDDAGTKPNFELDLALLLDGATIDSISGGRHVYNTPAPPELEKRNYNQLNLNFAHEGYSDLPMHPRNASTLLIRRFKPGSDFFSSGSRALQMAERNLEPLYKIENQKLGSKYTNYNCFNFFQTDYNSAVIYSAKSQKYMFDDAFTFEFYVKTKATTGSNCLFHLPGNYSISVISGSETNEKGFPTNYKLQVQLDTDSVPSKAPYHISSFGTKSFRSNANLVENKWHHCAIKWDSKNGKIRFSIDNIDSGIYSYTKGTLVEDPKALIIGGFWSKSDDSVSELEYFFNGNDDQGVGGLYAGTTNPTDRFVCNPEVELHELRMWNHYRSVEQLISGSSHGITGTLSELSGSGLSMYIPCLYEPAAPINTYYWVAGDVDIDSATRAFIKPEITNATQLFANVPSTYSASFSTPYNTNHANIGGFCNINVQSYSKEWIHSNYPYMHNMSESLKTWSSTHDLTSSWSGIVHHQKRNCLILPCDNGNFEPGWNILTSSIETNYFVSKDLAQINLKDTANKASFYDSRLFFVDEAYKATKSYIEPSQGTSTFQNVDERYDVSSDGTVTVAASAGLETGVDIPWNPLLGPSSELRKSLDDSDFVGNIVSVISIPQLYYGDQIEPESITLSSYLYNGTNSRVVIKDDGHGNLYRAQTSGSISKWNSVGDVYYKEGLIYIRNPSLFSIGEYNLDLEFSGRNYVNSLEMNIMCPKGLINSSSNPNYIKLRPSHNHNDKSSEFVYISTIYLHDENLNVIGKAKLAQPVIKRPENKYLFRLRMDF